VTSLIPPGTTLKKDKLTLTGMCPVQSLRNNPEKIKPQYCRSLSESANNFVGKSRKSVYQYTV
jgi:hypothetical protein